MIRVDDTLEAVMQGAWQDALRASLAELERATTIYGTHANAMEGASVLLEEFEELWEECRKKEAERNAEVMWVEATQVVAMCLRFVLDSTGYQRRLPPKDRLTSIVEGVETSFVQLCSRRPPLRSFHEGTMWIRREITMLNDALFLLDGNVEQDRTGSLVRYAGQAAAATLRLMVDLCWRPPLSADALGGSSTA